MRQLEARSDQGDPLTITSGAGGLARSENGESLGMVKAGGMRGVVVDLGSQTESISTQVYRCDQTRGSPGHP